MWLTRSGSGTAVEEPQTCAVAVDMRQGTPVIGTQPVDLGGPASGDQQHVRTLNGVLVENQNVTVMDTLHLKPRIPGKEGIGLGPFRSMMPGESRVQLT